MLEFAIKCITYNQFTIVLSALWLSLGATKAYVACQTIGSSLFSYEHFATKGLCNFSDARRIVILCITVAGIIVSCLVAGPLFLLRERRKFFRPYDPQEMHMVMACHHGVITREEFRAWEEARERGED